MKRSKFIFPLLAALHASLVLGSDRDPTRVLPPGQHPQDSRLDKPRDLNGYFPMTPPASLPAWWARRQELREQVLVATGLWPMPEKTPSNPVIHGKIDRDDYSVEKVFFASYPGHYVCGNLYRPKGKTGKLPAVLCPYGHWPEGRFNDNLADHGEKYLQDQINKGAEKTIEGARYPLQARCAHLARMGCVVFHYDMVGYADSRQIPHRVGFADAQAELRLQSFMGLQTFNSIRALDFLMGLPEVDPHRVGVTGASGGGTQTFILCAIDDRPTVAFPAVMVSTAMQGGCICENCSYLRQETGNVELAALFAPKPLGMTGANDWTREIETKGLPQLKALYKLYGAEDRVMAKCFPQFEHNYNQVSREVMYNWFNRHLRLGQPEPVVEKPFVPVPPKELSVFNQEHPRPGDPGGVEELRHHMTEMSNKQLEAVHPRDARSKKAFRDLVTTALRVMVHDRLPKADEVEAKVITREDQGKVHFQRMLLGRKGKGEQIPAVLVTPVGYDGTVVVWVDPNGKGSLMRDGKICAAASQVLNKKAAILAPDVFLTGEFGDVRPPEVNPEYAGYTWGYNRPLLANRVHDILTMVAFAQGLEGTKTIDLVGFGKAGPWALLARALCGDGVARTAVDMNQFSFHSVKATTDEMMLPGALKYGDVWGLAALVAPHALYLHNPPKDGDGAILRDAYQASNAPAGLEENQGPSPAETVLAWLLP